jgi:hypothetical protein
MDLQWTLCPFCGNQHIDPYRTGVVKVSDEDWAETAVSPQPAIPTETTLPENESDLLPEMEAETESGADSPAEA